VSNDLALFEPTALEVLNRRGTRLVQLFRGMIPEAWSTANDRMRSYDSALVPYLGSEYSQSQVKAALQDEQLGRALVAVTEAALRLDREHTALARLTVPVWLIMPFRAYLDRSLRARVSRTVDVLKETMTSMRQFHARTDPTKPLTASPHLQSGDVTAFLHDPEVPTEVAKRLLAGLRSQVTLDMVQAARRHRSWKMSSVKHALLDWSEDLLSALGLMANQPGVVIRSLPREYAFDLRAENENHQRRRQRLAAEALQAASDLKK
jgi:hypothetical protein